MQHNDATPISDTGSRKRRIRNILWIGGITTVIALCTCGWIIASIINFIEHTITMRWFIFIAVIFLSALYWKKSHWAWKAIAGIILVLILYSYCKRNSTGDSAPATPSAAPASTPRPVYAATQEYFPEPEITYGSDQPLQADRWYKYHTVDNNGKKKLYYFTAPTFGNNAPEFKRLDVMGYWWAIRLHQSDTVQITSD